MMYGSITAGAQCSVNFTKTQVTSSSLLKRIDPETDPEFWDYSFEEMGMLDSKAVIQYIKQKTGNEKITYMGMSQGTASMFYALSQDNEWFKDNINLY